MGLVGLSWTISVVKQMFLEHREGSGREGKRESHSWTGKKKKRYKYDRIKGARTDVLFYICSTASS